MRARQSRLPIRKAFKRNLIFFVLLPVLIVFAVFVISLYYGFHARAINNIELVHESLSGMLTGEVSDTSMLLASVMYTNNSVIIDYAEACDTDDITARYMARENLDQMLDYAFQSDSSILSMIFRFSSGRSVVYGSELSFSANPDLRHSIDSAEEDIVYVRAFRSDEADGGWSAGLSGNSMLYSAVFYPSWMLDSSRSITSVEMIRSSGLTQEITKYDAGYSLGNNSIGYTAVIDLKKGRIIASNRIDEQAVRDYLNGIEHFGYTYVASRVSINEMDSLILTVVRSSDITGSYLLPLAAVLSLILVVLFFFKTFSRLLMGNIISPVMRISEGLRAVESGNLDSTLEEEGYEEIRWTISSFNGMLRHERALIEDYKSRIKDSETRPERLFASFMSGSIRDEDIRTADEKLFSLPHILIALYTESIEAEEAKLVRCLDASLHFATQCYICRSESPYYYYIYYRDDRSGGRNEKDLIKELLSIFRTGFGAEPVVVYSKLLLKLDSSYKALHSLKMVYPLLGLYRNASVLQLDGLLDLSQRAGARIPGYVKLASALYVADEKTVDENREKLNSLIMTSALEDAKTEVLALSAAFIARLHENGESYITFFSCNPCIYDKVSSCADSSSLILFISNLMSEIVSISKANLDIEQDDAVIKAMRYIADNYQHSELSLESVSQYVELNSRYFSTKFSKQTGQSFQSYLAQFRIQKAKQLLRSTTFKVYEIAYMCGYAASESFNKAFRKETGISPLEYRKTDKK